MEHHLLQSGPKHCAPGSLPPANVVTTLGDPTHTDTWHAVRWRVMDGLDEYLPNHNVNQSKNSGWRRSSWVVGDDEDGQGKHDIAMTLRRAPPAALTQEQI